MAGIVVIRMRFQQIRINKMTAIQATLPTASIFRLLADACVRGGRHQSDRTHLAQAG